MTTNTTTLESCGAHHDNWLKNCASTWVMASCFWNQDHVNPFKSTENELLRRGHRPEYGRPGEPTCIVTGSRPSDATDSKDSWAVNLYRETYPAIRKVVLRNSGNEAEAEDVFQDAILVFAKKRLDSNFRLTASPGTFVFAVARNLWLKRLRERRRRSTLNGLIHMFAATSNSELASARGSWMLQHWLPLITPSCQSIIAALFIALVPIEQLMKKMGWRNLHTARNLKFKCLEQLRRVAARNQPPLPEYE